MEKAIADLEKNEEKRMKSTSKSNSSGVDNEKLEEFTRDFEKCKKLKNKF